MRGCEDARSAKWGGNCNGSPLQTTGDRRQPTYRYEYGARDRGERERGDSRAYATGVDVPSETKTGGISRSEGVGRSEGGRDDLAFGGGATREW